MTDFLPVGDYLPHRAPMLLLDRVIQVSDERVVCEVTINHQGVLAPFLNAQGELPAWFGVEIMAQTVGVWSGFHARQRGDRNIRPGMLLGDAAIVPLLPPLPQTARCGWKCIC